jgi:hypothetical protein
VVIGPAYPPIKAARPPDRPASGTEGVEQSVEKAKPGEHHRSAGHGENKQIAHLLDGRLRPMGSTGDKRAEQLFAVD